MDRIESIEFLLDEEYTKENFDPDNYYKGTYGVTVLSDKELINIELKVDRANAPYVVTKPFHPSQEMIGEFSDGAILIKLRVHHNYEFERLILGFGPSITVMKPRRLKQRIKKLVKLTHQNYYGEEGS